MNKKTFRVLPLCLAVMAVGGTQAQMQRATSQLGASTQLGTPAATAATTPSATTTATPAWTMPAAPAAPTGALSKRPTSVAATTTASRAGLFELADATPIVVGGRPTSAGALKTAIRAELAAKAGPAKTIRVGQRKTDFVDAAPATRTAAAAQTQPVRGLGQGFGAGANLGAGPAPLRIPARTTTTAGIGAASVSNRPTTVSQTTVPSYSESRCLDKGPPVISEVAGRLRPGGKVTVWGKCFGDRTGQVEVIGQFPGGKLTVAFTGWDQTAVDVEMPATVRGATDHTVAVTVVAADGRRSPAMQAKFVAAREHVEVPDRLWSPASGFELAATSDGPSTSNPAGSGHLARTLRINPQCGLDTMDMDVLAGSVSAIRGWEQGPPNEAAVTIDWAGTCLDTTTNVHYNYVVSQDNERSVRSACHVAMKPVAWAYCPVGVAP